MCKLILTGEELRRWWNYDPEWECSQCFVKSVYVSKERYATNPPAHIYRCNACGYEGTVRLEVRDDVIL